MKIKELFFYKNVNIDVSKSEKYLITTNDRKVTLFDFLTSNKLLKINSNYSIIEAISEKDDFCVFLANGETELIVRTLPDLENFAILKVNYALAPNFISTDEILFVDSRGGGEFSLQIWNFKTNKLEEILNDTDSERTLREAFWWNDSLYLICFDFYFKNIKMHKVTKRCVDTIVISGNVPYLHASQIVDSKVLLTKFAEKSEEIELLLFDLKENTFSRISKMPISKAHWLTSELFWVESANSGIFDLNGKCVYKVHGEYDIANRAILKQTSNPNFFICYNGFGSYLFSVDSLKRQSKRQSEDVRLR